MAAGVLDILIALLNYGFTFKFFDTRHGFNYKRPEQSVSNTPIYFLIYNITFESSRVGKHFGYGNKVLFDTFIQPSLYNTTNKRIMTTPKSQRSDNLVIILCLLLSGDIHQCPGPSITITNGLPSVVGKCPFTKPQLVISNLCPPHVTGNAINLNITNTANSEQALAVPVDQNFATSQQLTEMKCRSINPAIIKHR